MIDTKKAKVRLLSLAFHGALIVFSEKEKQNEALDMIHKTAKNYSPVSEDEYLIDSPSFWKWSRLAYVTKNHGQTVPDKDFCYIDVGTLDNVHQRLAAEENHVSAKDAPSRARKIVRVGDVLYSTVRPYLHNICIVDREFSRMPIASTAFCVMQPNESVLLNKFLFYWLLTPEFDRYSNGDPSKGALYPAIGEKDLLRGVIPIPSIEEQSLIVEKIDAAFSALDTIDSLQAKYSDNLSALKAKLIDAAIQGKLTEQLPEDGTAEELYQQIQEEKQALIKAGKIKKEKPLPEIKDEEIPFEIPGNWKWCRLLDLCKSVSDGDHQAPPQVKEGIPFLVISNVSKGYFDLTDVRHVPLDYYNLLPYERKAEQGDVLFTVTGSFGIPVIVDTGEEFCFQRHMALLKPLIDTAYLHHALQSGYVQKRCDDIAIGTAQRTVGIKQLRIIPIPLPPLAEQKRIVEILDRLLSTIEQ